ncbi:TaqI-like C-terminal specificity domain-containing protein [Clostridium ljungdahlii]|uniref:site-specific DNA-methyltransferase (adenine-specific) n=1 Tax=Clostridium ljungdahlii (strain ATCC 55383 / DSM 13528 / PETC) TaxID=748727 RepID=D8GPK5_CLOLD|nr:TaqI-like C-terminal specificity domain-containing protein [Clostridium ljungdahlii]ADK13914.1 predicted methyltransferase [Clostridium ljungdahlii DSM 13528]OAA87404.1 Type IIS restriction enzyme Eco57I [Clostridium ljungdahlii DSM 13528]
MHKWRDLSILGEMYERSMEKEERKRKGSFYTPHYIVDYIVKNIMSNLDLKKNPFIKVLDPSCGSGYFLVRVYEILMEKFSQNLETIRNTFNDKTYTIETEDGLKSIDGFHYWQQENLSFHILKKCIYGADIDSIAVELTKINLSKVSGININMEDNIICCNSLIKWNQIDNVEKYKESNIQSVVKFWNTKYDYVLGNPPWVSLSRKNKMNIEDGLLKYYSENYNGNTYLPNLYEYFIKRSMEILKPGGRFGFVVPDRLSRNLQYSELRKSLLENYNILNLVFEIDFPEINTDSMIMIAENKHRKVNKIEIDIYKKRTYEMYQHEYLKNSKFKFTYCCYNQNLSIKDCIEKNSSKLKSISKTFTGFIGYSKKITPVKKNQHQVEVLKGENIKKFRVLNNYYYDFVPENIIGGTKNIEKLTFKNKLVIRKTGKNLIAALDDKGRIIEQSLYGIISTNEEFSPQYILAILNSELIQWYYLNFLITNSNSIPQIKKCNLDEIPIRHCSRQAKEDIEKLVCKIINDNDQKNMLKKILDDEIFELYNIDHNYRRIILNDIENN